MAISSSANAQTVEANGYSVDAEFIRPTFGYGSFYGVDVPMVRKPMTFRYGAVLQYEAAPITLYDAVDQTEEGAIVSDRASVQLGASIDLSDRFTMNLLIPTAANWGTEIPQFASDGFGVGDVGAGARVIAIKTPKQNFNLGMRAGMMLPTGRQLSYMAEPNLRLTGGLLAMVQAGPVRVASDAGVMSRSTLETNEDFIIGPEVQWNNGVRVALPAATRMAFTGQVMSRAGLKAFLQGGAENAVEAMGGIQVLPSKAVTLDLGAGRGLTEGYGTTDLRVMSAIMIQHVPKPPPRPIVEEEPPPPPPPPPPPIVEDEPPAEVVFEEGELAKVHFDKIEIAEMPEFIVDTNVLKGEQSYEILTAVGKVLNEKAEIGHIVVEGHASQEGSFNHNYTLSESRARRIYEELIKVGVHPDRMSYRGKGEIAPLVLGEDEASLQANRRVEFHILFQHEEVEDMPDYPDTTILPWNGEVVPVVQPPKPEPPAEPEETGPRVDEFGLPLDDDEEMEIDLGPMPTDEDAAEDTDAEQE